MNPETPTSSRSSRSRRHLAVLAVAAATAAINAGEQASAASVGIHFRYLDSYTYSYATGSTMNTSAGKIFAGVSSSFWNNMAPIDNYFTGGSQTGQTLTTAGASGITVDYTARNSWGAAFDTTFTDDTAPYWSYLDDGGNGYKVTIHGLSSFLALGESYQITGLQGTDTVGATFANVKIYLGTDTTGTLLDTLTSNGTFAFPDGKGTYGDTTVSVPLTANEITIVGDPRNTGIGLRSTLSGLAIVTVPEPTTLPLVAVGLAIFARRRKRQDK